MTPFETEEYKGYEIELYPDYDAESPRTAYDNLSHMVCFHGRYDLGDQHDFRESDYTSWEDLLQRGIKASQPVALAFPLYLYDHSGLRIKIGSFHGLLPQGHAEFDSGQVGWVVVYYSTLRKEYGSDPEAKEKAERCVREEVKLYDAYLSGQSCLFNIRKGDEVEVMAGFYTSDDAMEAAREEIDAMEAA